MAFFNFLNLADIVNNMSLIALCNRDIQQILLSVVVLEDRVVVPPAVLCKRTVFSIVRTVPLAWILVDCHLCNLIQMCRSIYFYPVSAFSVVSDPASSVPLALFIDGQRLALKRLNLHIAILADGFFDIRLNFVVPLLRVFAEYKFAIRLDHRPVALV